MKIELIEGEFKSDEALQLITALIKVKIDFHEKKIHLASNEEDIKARESKIIKLQNVLSEARLMLSSQQSKHAIHAEINIA
jgi:hypothetical protein